MEKSEHKKTQRPSDLEEQMYRSCLKQVVKFLNTTLPPLSESDESIAQSTVPSTKKTKVGKNPKRDTTREDGNSYSLRDVTPSKTRENAGKKTSKKASNNKKGSKSKSR